MCFREGISIWEMLTGSNKNVFEHPAICMVIHRDAVHMAKIKMNAKLITDLNAKKKLLGDPSLMRPTWHNMANIQI